MYKNKNFMFLHFVDNNINMEEKTHLVVHGSIDVSVETDRGDLSCLGQLQELLVYDATCETCTQPHTMRTLT